MSNHPIDQHVGARVRHGRMLVNISQTELGNAVGVTFQQIQKYEKGANRISVSKLARIAEVLQQPVSWFFEGAPTTANSRNDRPAPVDPVAQLGLNPRGVDLARVFVGLPIKLQHAVIDLVERLRENVK